ncbi:mevalonate kinase [Suicoccus acidiformans]|uniref:mevalonate kinase n=1 Tax=Suicoccus acidiformans TaxID=2036206 RepID=A0A347WMW8_9LACT|nr:mevalonate kinase [Suicoccus acidiformans]AXY26425.1 mevalonate kinase [Suicoccus acidiformans]
MASVFHPTHLADILSNKIGYGEAHSKIILMGEHAVVYDYPAIAMPFPKAKAQAQVTLSEDGLFHIHSRVYSGLLESAPENLDNIRKAIELTLQICQMPTEALGIRIDSSIPEARGMGSSAAVAVAVVRAIAQFYQQEITDNQLHFIVNQAEVIAHGSTSGLDTLVTSSTDAFLYRKSKQPLPFKLNIDGFLILADSGQIGQTKEAVEKVRQLKEKKAAFVKEAMATIGDFVAQAKVAIEYNDIYELGRLMTYNHYYLNQLEVSNQTLDSIINAAWMAGALGAKLTGGGLGGCVISLTETKEKATYVAHKMKEAGAQKTWILPLRQS